MPSADAILAGVTSTAREWRGLAAGWHLALAAMVGAMIVGWRPRTRTAAWLLATPMISVSAMAWAAGNPFNGSTFAVLAAGMLVLAARSEHDSIRISSLPWVTAGAFLVAFGWVYPHFLAAGGWLPYLYASPFGLIPCPTLSVVIGLTLICRRLESPGLSLTLAAAGLFYGVFGVVRLGVSIDLVLAGGAVVLAIATWREPKTWWSVRATSEERRCHLPGDDLIADPVGTFTHATTIRRRPEEIWPWLAQMGAGTRAGWYSYDWIDNGRRPSDAEIRPELQHVEVGTLFPALPGASDGFTVLAVEPCRSLTLGWVGPDGRRRVTWTFVLSPLGARATRLLVRARGASGYSFQGLPAWLSKYVVRLVHFVMERRQLLGIARRAELVPGR